MSLEIKDNYRKELEYWLMEIIGQANHMMILANLELSMDIKSILLVK